jgi:hypothetical protein
MTMGMLVVAACDDLTREVSDAVGLANRSTRTSSAMRREIARSCLPRTKEELRLPARPAGDLG